MARGKSKGANFIAQGIHFTEEFTSLQLVIGISVLMLFGLICFLAGILVGRMDTSLQRAETPVENATPAEISTAKAPASKPAPKPGKEQEKPKPTSKPTTNTGTSTGPRVTDLPPLPAPGTKPPTPKPVAPKPEPAPVSAPVAKPAPASTPSTFLDPISPPPATPSKPDTPPVPASTVTSDTNNKKPPATTSVALGNFGIQLAAFSGDNRNNEAATFQRRLKENAKMDSQIIPGTDGYTRVIIPGFNTRDEANKALDGIKQKAGLSDVYIRPLP